jgi:arsenate reductase
MTAVTLYHNPRCSKSRQTMTLLESKGVDFAVREYLNEPLSADELNQVIAQLGVTARDIVRTSEDEYDSMQLNDPSRTDKELIDAIVQAPILMQRPIVTAGNQARIGRPPESVLEIL